MPKASEKLTEDRKNEIISACAKLYETMSFKDITIKEIGSAISCTRTSVYNYFQTKEEIFLALLQSEYQSWIDSLNKIQAQYSKLSRTELAQAFAHSLEDRKTLLKLLSMNLYDMEVNSRIERLVELKVTYGKALSTVESCLKKFCPEMSRQEIQDFIYSFFPFIFGIYPYTAVSKRQKEAMVAAGVNFLEISVYDITLKEVKKLLDV